MDSGYFFNHFLFATFFFILSKLYGLIDLAQVNNLDLGFFCLRTLALSWLPFFTMEKKLGRPAV